MKSNCADQGTPSIRRETNYVEQDESEETENQNMGPQGLADEAVGPRVVAASWKDELEARFALVDRVDEAGPINPHPRAAGPSKT